MTTNTNDGFLQTLASGGETTIDFDFIIYAKADLQVLETDGAGVISELTLNTDYTIATDQLNDPTGGEIVLVPGVYPSGAVAGHLFSCRSNAIEKRATDFQQGGDFFAATLNNQLDYQTTLLQQHRRDLNQAVRVSRDSDIVDLFLQDAPQDGYGIVWDGVDGLFRNTAASLAVLEVNAATVVANIASIDAVAGDLTAINAVYADLTALDSVAADLTALNAVAADLTAINTVNTNIANVNTVAGVSANVTTVAGISANVTTVAGVSAAVTTVAGVSTAVSTVSGIQANVTTVAGISANVTTVAGVSANVTTVAGIAADVTTCATNIAAILAAPAAATAAAASAAAAAASAASGLYNNIIDLTFSNSPYIPLVAANGDLYRIDTSGGNVVINLNLLATYAHNMIFAFVKTTGDANTITVNRGGTDTISGATSITISTQYEVHVLVGEQSSGSWLDTVQTTGIADGAVTMAKLANLAQDLIIGRAHSAGTGVPKGLSKTEVIAIVSGTSAGDLVALDGSAKLPAVDGSQLTGLPAGGFIGPGYATNQYYTNPFYASGFTDHTMSANTIYGQPTYIFNNVTLTTLSFKASSAIQIFGRGSGILTCSTLTMFPFPSSCVSVVKNSLAI